jgi:ATP-dependent DNA ligase
MTERFGFLAQLPVRAVLDGELVALDADGKPDFPLICEWPPQWRTPQAFDDGEAQWEAVCSHELEGVVAQRGRSLTRGASCRCEA